MRPPSNARADLAQVYLLDTCEAVATRRADEWNVGCMCLNTMSDAYRCDVIAIGSGGNGLLRRALLGSVAERILHEAACDVLVARLPEV